MIDCYLQTKTVTKDQWSEKLFSLNLWPVLPWIATVTRFADDDDDPDVAAAAADRDDDDEWEVNLEEEEELEPPPPPPR